MTASSGGTGQRTGDPAQPRSPKPRSAKAKSLPKRRLTTLRKNLEDERERLIAQIERLDAEFRDESWKEPRSDDDAYSGSATYERERTMSLARNARAMVIQIDEALARIEAGTYGLCVSCGQAVSPERLEAIPQASDCLDCRRQAERSAR